MPKFIIERNMPGAGRMSDSEWQQGSVKSCDVLREMGPNVQWVESYVTDDKVYCVYIAENEAQVREHGKKAEFPVDNVTRVRRMIDPTTAEMPDGTYAKSQPVENRITQ